MSFRPTRAHAVLRSIAANVRDLRQERVLTQETLAEAATEGRRIEEDRRRRERERMQSKGGTAP